MTEARPHRLPGDGWVECACGQKHWGLLGAAGLLVFRTLARPQVLLQHRAQWSHHGGTWGIPGGAIAPGESALQGALREAREETGLHANAVEPIGAVRLDHGTWRYTTILAILAPSITDDIPDDLSPRDTESIELRWVAAASVALLPLLPAFAEQWPLYLAAADRAVRRKGISAAVLAG